MKLLICTQAVDTEDPVLGFFVRWIEELAKRVEQVEVICLKEGRHSLPSNVEVIALGKTSRLIQTARLWRACISRHSDYDAVFVHMNQEYILAAGWLWKLLGKRVYMWRNHYAGSWQTDVAAFFCTKVFCTSKHSYTAKCAKTILMPVGVDTERFFPDERVIRTPHSILFLSRMSPSKRPEMLVDALALLARDGIDFTVSFVGSPIPRDEAYYESLKNKVCSLALANRVTFLPGVPNSQTPDLYRTHEIFVNTSPSGMFDKTIFEAAACGCLPLASSADYTAQVDARFTFTEHDTSSLSETLSVLFMLSEAARAPLMEHLKVVVKEQSLSKLMENLSGELGGTNRKIRVLFALPSLLVGGIEGQLMGQLARYDRSRFSLRVLALFDYGSRPTVAERLPADVPLYPIGFRHAFDIAAWSRLIRTLHRVRPDVVVSSMFSANTAIRLLKPFFRYRVIAREHNIYDEKTFVQRVTDHLLSYLACRIIAVSRDVADFASKQALIPRSKFIVIQNGVDIERIDAWCTDAGHTRTALRRELAVPEHSLLFLNVARLKQQKNQAALIRAFVTVAKEHPECLLAIAGDGIERPKLEALVEELGCATQVRILGHRKDIFAWYGVADWFVLPSLREGFPNGMLEAMAFALPIIATPVSGSNECVEDDINGFVTGPSEIAIQAVLTKAIGLPEALRRQFASAAREKVLNFDMREVAQRYEKQFVSCLPAD